MSDYLIRQIRAYFETHEQETAVAVERRANVPGATITKITQGSRPRVDRLAQLLTGVDNETAAEWLRAYLLDDVPSDYSRNVRIVVDPLGSTTIQEITPITREDKFTSALERMRLAGQADDQIAQWFIDSVLLICGEDKNSTNESREAQLAYEMARNFAKEDLHATAPTEPRIPAESLLPGSRELDS